MFAAGVVVGVLGAVSVAGGALWLVSCLDGWTLRQWITGERRRTIARRRAAAGLS